MCASEFWLCWGSTCLNLKVDHKHHRAHSGGTGGVKSCTNYSHMKPLQFLRKKPMKRFQKKKRYAESA
ncbi:unnamed protein product [Brassica oleracea]